MSPQPQSTASKQAIGDDSALNRLESIHQRMALVSEEEIFAALEAPDEAGAESVADAADSCCTFAFRVTSLSEGRTRYESVLTRTA